MTVRCGRCGSAFDVPGPGRHGCPACGTVNEVRPATEAPPPPRPEQPSPRVACGDCGFSFIVGAVEEAPCPNCGTRVGVDRGSGREA